MNGATFKWIQIMFLQSFIWPEHTGLSLGAEGDPSFFVMETHYSNPDLRDGKSTCNK